MFSELLRRVFREIQPLKNLIAERNFLKNEIKRIHKHVPPGHFYSPYPSLDEIARDRSRIFNRSEQELPGIDLNIQEQLRFLSEFKKTYSEIPFTAQENSKLRYYFENPSYSYSDGICLYR